MKQTPFKLWDSADYLKTDEDMAGFLEACFEEAGDDPAFIAHALAVIARAREKSQGSRYNGITRERWYSALSEDANPKFETILQAVAALGLEFRVVPASA